MPVQRQVRRLRVACARDDDARRARTQLEDALRTASLRDEGRLIFVRQLDLGRMPRGASATTWSRQLEERFQRTLARVVPLTDPHAADAPAVTAADVIEPWLQLIDRLVEGRPCDAWFWPQAAPGWHRGMDLPKTLRLAFRHVAAAQPLAALALLRRLVARGLAARLLAAISEAEVARIVEAVAARDPVVTTTTADEAEVPFPAQPWTRKLLQQLAALDARAVLVVAAALAEAGLPVPTRQRLGEITRQWCAWTRDVAARSADVAAEHPATPVTAPRERDFAEAAKVGVTEGRKTGELLELDRTADPRQRTSAGGLLFLVRLLEAEGIPALPVSDSGFPWQFFRAVLRVVRARDDDPWRALPHPALPHPRGLMRRTLLRAHGRSRAWTGLTLRELVLRPAWVTITDTHLDVLFLTGDADVRIRRAGLDLNLGWVPWLQRVITFHYNLEVEP